MGDAYDYATPVDILGLLAKEKLTCDDDPPIPFWDALEHKKWGLRKVRPAGVLQQGHGMVGQVRDDAVLQRGGVHGQQPLHCKWHQVDLRPPLLRIPSPPPCLTARRQRWRR